VPEEVAPLVAAINDLLSRLDRSIATQKHFLADAAHQLKTPLAGLRMQAELAAARDRQRHGDPASLKRSLQQIALSSQRAAHMVNQLLAMARAEDKGTPLRKTSVDLAELARETVRDFVPRPWTSASTWATRARTAGQNGRTARLFGEPVLLRELVRNLVDNALQYTPAGGTVTVRVVPDPFGRWWCCRWRTPAPASPGRARAGVPAVLPRAGHQVDGSGLGLAIVREIAEHHGADISVADARPRSARCSRRHSPGTRVHGAPASRCRCRPRAARRCADGCRSALHQPPAARHRHQDAQARPRVTIAVPP
jgi:two-component system sensor histidine kinase TctE